jgi:hypothetical protein
MLEIINNNLTNLIRTRVRAIGKALGVSHLRTALSEGCQETMILQSLMIMLVSQAFLTFGLRGLGEVAIASMMTTDLPIMLTFIKISLKRLRMKMISKKRTNKMQNKSPKVT